MVSIEFNREDYSYILNIADRFVTNAANVEIAKKELLEMVEAAIDENINEKLITPSIVMTNNGGDYGQIFGK